MTGFTGTTGFRTYTILAIHTCPSTYRLLGSGRDESVLLGSVAVCFLLAELMGVSMELGCFLAGVAVTTMGTTVVDRVSDNYSTNSVDICNKCGCDSPYCLVCR